MAPSRRVRISVSDTGCRMGKDVIAHIFEPFYTTKPTGQGTGLGLATVYGVVTEAGGSLNVYSEPNLGTTCRAYFPVVAEAGLPLPAAPEHAQPPRGLGQQVMVVDDEDAIRDMATRILVGHGYPNGADNRDGEGHNRSWNCGVEGPSSDPDVYALRARQRRNLLATLPLSQGVANAWLTIPS